jgi:hypothetical protein
MARRKKGPLIPEASEALRRLREEVQARRQREPLDINIIARFRQLARELVERERLH